MSASAALAQIADWFSVAETASMVMPDGWFGRPFDNMHRLTWSASRTGKLFLELDEILHLVVSDPEVVRDHADRLELKCTQLIFDRREFGSDGRRHAQIHREGGLIIFHASGVEN